MLCYNIFSWESGDIKGAETNSCWDIEYCFNTSSQHLFHIWTFCTPLFPCPVWASQWNGAAKRKKEIKRSFWSPETVVRQQRSAMFSLYTTRHANVHSLLFYIFSLRKNSNQLYERRKAAKKAERLFSGSKRCFRDCGLQIDLPVYWSGLSHASQENHLPELSGQQSFWEHLPHNSQDAPKSCQDMALC